MTENKSTDRNKNSDDDLKQIITRVGFLTRMLRESMRELGLEKGVQQAVATIPDGKDRLRYIAQMTAQAAEKNTQRHRHYQAVAGKNARGRAGFAGALAILSVSRGRSGSAGIHHGVYPPGD